MKALSKSKIVAYRQCQKRLWLEVHKPELREDSQSAQANFASGNRVGEVAQALYDDGSAVVIDFNETGLNAAFDQSAALLNSRQIIFEAGMRAGGALAFADIMQPMNKRGKIKWKMIEVKGSTSVKDYQRDDVALQCYVAKEQGIEIGAVSLAHLDNQWVYEGDGNYHGLLIEADLTEEALSRHEEVKGWVEQAQAIVKKKKEPDVEIGKHCNEPFECGFYHYCSRNHTFAEQPVQWLPRIQSKALNEAIEAGGITEMADVPDALLNDIQKRVKQVTITGKTFFDKKKAKAMLSPQTFPAYFLDFESIQFAVPIWKGTRSYQQIVFQYSLHCVDKNMQLTHKEFLETEGKDPQKNLVQHLIKNCGKRGPIYVYNRGFESRCIKELANAFPAFRSELLAINERLIDLLPVARSVYYHPSQQGSWSIKKVLPALVPELQYSDLEGVQDGGSAQQAYLALIDESTAKEQKVQLQQQLLAYCKLDTLAMVKIWEIFSQVKVKQ